MASDSEVVENGRGKRKDKCIRTYIDAEGEALGSRAKNEARAVKLEVKDADYEVTLSYDEMPESVRCAAALYGAVNSITNTIGKAGMSAADMVEALEDRIAAIWTDGVWAEGAQGGPRTNDVLEAVCRWYTDKKGPVTEEWKANMKQKLADDKPYADAIKAKPEIGLIIESIRMERQAERLAKAKAKAEGQESEDLDDLLS